jgi:hypothetical protein
MWTYWLDAVSRALTAMGSPVVNFVFLTLLPGAIAFFAPLVWRWNSLRGRRYLSPLREAWNESIRSKWQVSLFFIGVSLWLTVFSYYLCKTIYEEHSQLQAERNEAKDRLERIRDANEKLLANQIPLELENSLRRRTLALVGDLYMFWAARPMPPQPTPNAETDEDKARVAKSQKYWRETQAAYSMANFNQRILGIVREYKAKGVPTGYLEVGAEQERLMGAMPFGGFDLQNCQTNTNELCEIQELAYHVDSRDQAIFLTIEQLKRRK